MHDLDDRTRRQYEPGHEREDEYYEDEGGLFAGEYGESDMESEYADSGETVFDEMDEMDLASELLGINDEEELDQFLGKLLKKAGRAAGQFLKSGTGRALTGILKNAARQALPIAGTALGGMLGGPIGANLGGMAAQHAGKLFGLEVEGMSEEDAQFETARRFVRFAGAAAQGAVGAPAGVSPQQAARAAALAAARQHAPGLLRGGEGASGHGGTVSGVPGQSGRWVRRGRRIILFGL